MKTGFYDARYHAELLHDLTKMARPGKKKKKMVPEDSSNSACLLIYESVLHKIKAVARKYNVIAVFRNHFEFERMRPFLKRAAQECNIKHKDKTITSKTRTVREIPMTCGFRDMSQTGRYVNIRLNKHKRCM